jgi:hypothetical protein
MPTTTGFIAVALAALLSLDQSCEPCTSLAAGTLCLEHSKEEDRELARMKRRWGKARDADRKRAILEDVNAIPSQLSGKTTSQVVDALAWGAGDPHESVREHSFQLLGALFDLVAAIGTRSHQEGAELAVTLFDLNIEQSAVRAVKCSELICEWGDERDVSLLRGVFEPLDLELEKARRNLQNWTNSFGFLKDPTRKDKQNYEKVVLACQLQVDIVESSFVFLDESLRALVGRLGLTLPMEVDPEQLQEAWEQSAAGQDLPPRR